MCKYNILSYQCGHQTVGSTVPCGRVPDPENPCWPGHIYYIRLESINSQQYIEGDCPTHKSLPAAEDEEYAYQGRLLFIFTWQAHYNTLLQRFADMNAEYVNHWITADRRIKFRQPCHDLLYNVEMAPQTASGHMLNPITQLGDLLKGRMFNTSKQPFPIEFTAINELLKNLTSTADLLSTQLAEVAVEAAQAVAHAAAQPRATLDQPREAPWVMNFDQDTRDVAIMAGTDAAGVEDVLAQVESRSGTFITGWSVMVGGLAGRTLPPPPARRGGGHATARRFAPAAVYGTPIFSGPSTGGGLGGGAREAAAAAAVDELTEEKQ